VQVLTRGPTQRRVVMRGVEDDDDRALMLSIQSIWNIASPCCALIKFFEHCRLQDCCKKWGVKIVQRTPHSKKWGVSWPQWPPGIAATANDQLFCLAN